MLTPPVPRHSVRFKEKTHDQDEGRIPPADVYEVDPLPPESPPCSDTADGSGRSQSLQLDGASDHGVSEALYLRDPDQNGVELYRDRPMDEWPRKSDGSLDMYTRPLDLQRLLAESSL